MKECDYVTIFQHFEDFDYFCEYKAFPNQGILQSPPPLFFTLTKPMFRSIHINASLLQQNFH